MGEARREEERGEEERGGSSHQCEADISGVKLEPGEGCQQASDIRQAAASICSISLSHVHTFSTSLSVSLCVCMCVCVCVCVCVHQFTCCDTIPVLEL